MADPTEVFEMLQLLGEGSYGRVYKAKHVPTQKIVAVKKVLCEAASELDDLMNEIEILRSCKSPFITGYAGSYRAPNSEFWVIMEYCQGGSLGDLMHAIEAPLSEALVAVCTASVLLGLEYLHANRAIHRDIKCGNILLTSDGRATLADFGVSAKLNSTIGKANTVIGTPFWMAPEVIQEDNPYDGKADIWSLGITVIEMAEMRPPHSDVHPMRVIFMIPSRPAPTLTHAERWSPEIQSFLARCLQKDPEARASCAAALEDPFVATLAASLRDSKGVSKLLADFVARSLADVDAYRVEQERRSNSRGGGGGGGGDGTIGTMIAGGGDTMVYATGRGDTMRTGEGTMVVGGGRSGSRGTMVVDADSGAAGNTPAYMVYLREQNARAQQRASDAAQAQRGASRKWADEEEEDQASFIDSDATLRVHRDESPEITAARKGLRRRLRDLDEQYREEAQSLRTAYEQQRQTILDVLETL
jgi:serine/threonine kinase 3